MPKGIFALRFPKGMGHVLINTGSEVLTFFGLVEPRYPHGDSEEAKQLQKAWAPPRVMFQPAELGSVRGESERLDAGLAGSRST